MLNAHQQIVFPIGLALSFSLSVQGAEPFSAAEKEWQQYQNYSNSQYEDYERQELHKWEDYRKKVAEKWKEVALPEEKKFVGYSDDFSSRVRVDYEHETLTVETLLDETDEDAAKKKIQASLETTVSKDSSANAVLTQDDISTATFTKPNISVEKTVAGDGKSRELYRLSTKLAPNFIIKRAQRVKPIVDYWASRYHLESAFVLALIRQESCFNPRSRSWVPAYGLMQIVPKYAGQEVFKAVTGKARLPEADFLYDSQKNIMVGATYLKILRDDYFPEIKDGAKARYVIAASYNWGPHRIQKAMKKGRLPASSSASATFDIIQQIAPEETRNYVRKTAEYYESFKKAGL